MQAVRKKTQVKLVCETRQTIFCAPVQGFPRTVRCVSVRPPSECDTSLAQTPLRKAFWDGAYVRTEVQTLVVTSSDAV